MTRPNNQDAFSMATAFEKGKNNDDDEFVLFLYIPLIFSFVSHSNDMMQAFTISVVFS